MFCPNCGRALEEGTRFCPGCGKPVQAGTPARNTPPASAAPAAGPSPTAGPSPAAAPVFQANPAVQTAPTVQAAPANAGTGWRAAQARPLTPEEQLQAQRIVQTQPLNQPAAQAQPFVQPTAQVQTPVQQPFVQPAAQAQTPVQPPMTQPKPFVQPAAQVQTPVQPQPFVQPAARPLPQVPPQIMRFDALKTGGEAALGLMGAEMSIPSAGSVVKSGVGSFLSSFVSVFKSPAKWIPAAVLAVVWIVLAILKVKGVDAFPVKGLSFLTFGEGGLGGGIVGVLGGIAGKGVVAGALVALVGLFTKKSSDRSGRSGGAKSSPRDLFGVNGQTVGAYLTGMGAAVLLYLFFSGVNTRFAFMCGAAACFLAVRAAIGNGFLKSFLEALTSKGKAFASPTASALIGGLAAGFAAAALLGLLNIPLIHWIAGGVLFVGGIVLMIVLGTQNRGKEGWAA